MVTFGEVYFGQTAFGGIATVVGTNATVEAELAAISSEAPVSSLRLDKIFDAPRLRIGQEDVY